MVFVCNTKSNSLINLEILQKKIRKKMYKESEK